LVFGVSEAMAGEARSLFNKCAWDVNDNNKSECNWLEQSHLVKRLTFQHFQQF
jgi:hypothetical protein